MGFDAEIKVRLSAEEKKALQAIADQRPGGVKSSVIVREAIEEYLARVRKNEERKAARREKDLS
jgi:predicted DNA-binding protein